MAKQKEHSTVHSFKCLKKNAAKIRRSVNISDLKGMLHVVLVLTDTLLHLDFGNSFGFKHHQFLKRYPASQGRFAHGLQPVKS